MPDVQASPEAFKIITRSRNQFFKIQMADEVTLRNIYREAGRNLSAKISAYEGSPTYLKRIFSQVESEVKRLNRGTTKAIDKSIDQTAQVSLRGQIRAITVHQAGMKAYQTYRLNSHNFSKTWHAVVRSLSVPIDGIQLSSRVWDIHQMTLMRMNRYLGRAFAEGVPLSQMTQEIKKFLVIPDSDMRMTKWKDFFKEYPPGRGVYKSAYKNAERVMRTEMNRAFREAAVQYGIRMKSWLKGIQWVRSNYEPCPLCDELANRDMYNLGPGVYPPEAFPTHSHPHCVCYSLNIPKENIILSGQQLGISAAA